MRDLCVVVLTLLREQIVALNLNGADPVRIILDKRTFKLCGEWVKDCFCLPVESLDSACLFAAALPVEDKIHELELNIPGISKILVDMIPSDGKGKLRK